MPSKESATWDKPFSLQRDKTDFGKQGQRLDSSIEDNEYAPCLSALIISGPNINLSIGGRVFIGEPRSTALRLGDPHETCFLGVF